MRVGLNARVNMKVRLEASGRVRMTVRVRANEGEIVVSLKSCSSCSVTFTRFFRV